MSKIEEKLQALGLTCPSPPPKAPVYPGQALRGEAGVHLRLRPLRRRAPVVGKLGEEVTQEQGYDYARDSMLNVLAVLKAEVGDLDLVKCPVKVTCFVASTRTSTPSPRWPRRHPAAHRPVGPGGRGPQPLRHRHERPPRQHAVETEAIFELK